MKTVQEHFSVLRSEEKRRYIVDKTPDILCALIGRRASTNPLELVDLAKETAGLLYEALTPAYSPRNGLGAEMSTNSHQAVTQEV
jgi:hypothetical protein